MWKRLVEKNVEKAFIIYRGTSEYKTCIFNVWFLGYFCKEFHATNTSRGAIKRPFQWYIFHICGLHSFGDTREIPEVIDIDYPWSGGAVAYQKNISHSMYPYTQVIYGAWWGINSFITGPKALPSQLHNYSPNSLVTDIPPTKRQWIKDDHLSISMRFFSLPLGTGSGGRGPPL